MNKRDFEKYILKNLGSIKQVNCNIMESFDIDNNECCWLEVYIWGNEFTTVFCSDDYPLDSSEVVKLQKSWEKKLNSWLNPNWGIPLVVDRVSV